MIIVATPFPKSSVFSRFSADTKTKSRFFSIQIPLVWRDFSNRSVFVTVGQAEEIKMHFQISALGIQELEDYFK